MDWYEYAKQLGGLMGLEGWRLIEGLLIPDEGDDGDKIARIVCTYGQRSAVLHVCLDFDSLKPEQQRRSLVHELVHAHLDRIRVTGRSAFCQLGIEAREMAEAQLHDEIEYATDGIAAAWAETLPLPPDTTQVE